MLAEFETQLQVSRIPLGPLAGVLNQDFRALFPRVVQSGHSLGMQLVFRPVLRQKLLVLGDLESLADTTVLLLLSVFVTVNIAVLVLRRDPVDHDHWRAPTVLPALGAAACLALIVQKAFDDAVIFAYAGGLLALGVVLWAISRALTGPAEPIDPAKLAD